MVHTRHTVAGSSKSKGNGSELACTKAMGNARSGIEAMLAFTEKNFKAGYMDKAKYEAGTKGLLSISAKLSVAECQSSSGSLREFYQCMSSDGSQVDTAGKDTTTNPALCSAHRNSPGAKVRHLVFYFGAPSLRVSKNLKPFLYV
ncbi:hypothetical protein [Undibacterium sp. Ren11W]|uniref:hypothetical protein n=1 Tax=Undibacterium sp. Ren11W TaxID=3413045 RepID=UPI003BF1DD5F